MMNSNRENPIFITKGVLNKARGMEVSNMNSESSKMMSPLEALEILGEDYEDLLYQYRCLRETPRQIVDRMNLEVSGQENSVEKIVHVCYYNQVLNLLEEIGEPAKKRINVVMIGPTGCGKTTIIKSLEKNFQVPVARYSADQITSAGYIGKKVEDMLIQLFYTANCDLARAERGIIYIDEFDKKCEQETSAGKDINGRAVQEELLKILEPNQIDLILPDKRRVPFDTSKLTVILGGAFVGLDKIRLKRLSKKNIGFGANEKYITEEAAERERYISKDLIDFGFIPEIVGRIFLIEELRKLTVEDGLRIVYESKNSIFIEQSRFIADVLNVEMSISKKYVEEMVKEIMDSGTGVRGLEARVTNMFLPIMQQAFEHSEYGLCIIDDEGYYSLEYDEFSYYGEVGKWT